jgi:hypothetical protein
MLLFACHSIPAEKKVLDQYAYIDKAVKSLGLDKTGIIATRDTNMQIHDLPNVVCFNKEGKMIRSFNCISSVEKNLKLLVTNAGRLPVLDTAADLSAYLAAQQFKLLDGTPLQPQKLPSADYYYFYEWSAVFTIDYQELQAAENFIFQHQFPARICFIKVNAYDARSTIFKEKQPA